jgi:Ca2+-binding RTX toxin-like protein
MAVHGNRVQLSSDTLEGGAGNDTGAGGAGDDSIAGGDGADRLDGGLSADVLDGGRGNDRLTGGEGDDTFRYFSDSGRDTIIDFSTTNDKFEIRAGGVDDFDDLVIRDNANGDAVIRYTSDGLTTTITLLGVSSGALSTDDFSFG